MAYDRYEPRDHSRDERPRWRDETSGNRDWERGSREDRGFFERAGDEIASWFGEDDAERRRRQDQRFEGRDRGFRDRGWERSEGRGFSAGDRDFNPSWRNRYRRDRDREEAERGRSWRDEPSRNFDPHYHSWRSRQMDELDRDYDDYRRENQSRFESDFGNWRERRMHKRSMLGQIREHMEVVGNDDQHVGTVDRVAGDRIILTKSDPESGGVHHSLSCADLDRVEGDRAILDCSADQAKQRWRDESRGRALFEREDQGEMGDRALNRSFEGTYRE